MKSIKKPFLVALDSSTYGDISRDFYHSENNRKFEAQKIIRFFIDNAWVPVITWHHIEELLAHESDRIVLQSLLLFKQFPLVASLKCHNAPQHIGSIIDIEIAELNEVINNNQTSLKEIIKRAKKNLFTFCSGNEFITPCIENIEYLKIVVRNKVNKKREIASISRAQSIQPENFKLSSVGDWKLQPFPSAAAKLNNMRTSLEDEIKHKGDKKIDNPGNTASEFILSVLGSGKNMYLSSGTVKQKFLKEFGITPKEIEKFKYFDQIKYLTIFKKRLSVIVENFPEYQQESISELQEENCPSWLLWKELHKIRTKAERASGSDVNDGYLVSLTYYAGLTVVDKRTHEYLTQICRKNNLLKGLIGSHIKLSNYSKIKSVETDLSH